MKKIDIFKKFCEEGIMLDVESNYKKVQMYLNKIERVIGRKFRENEFEELCFLLKRLWLLDSLDSLRLEQILKELDIENSLEGESKWYLLEGDNLESYESMCELFEDNENGLIEINKNTYKETVLEGMDYLYYSRMDIFDKVGIAHLLEIKKNMNNELGILNKELKSLLSDLENGLLDYLKTEILLRSPLYGVRDVTVERTLDFNKEDLLDYRNSLAYHYFQYVFLLNNPLELDGEFCKEINFRDVYPDYEFKKFPNNVSNTEPISETIESDVERRDYQTEANIELFLRQLTAMGYKFKTSAEQECKGVKLTKTIGFVLNEDDKGKEKLRVYDIGKLGVLDTIIVKANLKKITNEIARNIMFEIKGLSNLRLDLWDKYIVPNKVGFFSLKEIVDIIAKGTNGKADLEKIYNNLRKLISNYPKLASYVKEGVKPSKDVYTKEDVMFIIYFHNAPKEFSKLSRVKKNNLEEFYENSLSEKKRKKNSNVPDLSKIIDINIEEYFSTKDVNYLYGKINLCTKKNWDKFEIIEKYYNEILERSLNNIVLVERHIFKQ